MKIEIEYLFQRNLSSYLDPFLDQISIDSSLLNVSYEINICSQFFPATDWLGLSSEFILFERDKNVKSHAEWIYRRLRFD
jgi:hypothetical protein